MREGRKRRRGESREWEKKGKGKEGREVGEREEEGRERRVKR